MSLYTYPPAATIAPPAGAATSSNQALQITQETLINTNLGADITTPTAMPAGGSGVRGWLSAIWTKLNGTLTVNTISGFNLETTQALVKAKTDNLDVALSTRNLETTQLLIKAKTDNIPAQGQALAASSAPVVLTAIQQAALTPPAAITGFNLEATQLLIKADVDKIPPQGQALAAASMPVVLTAIQQAALTPPVAITGFNLESTQLLIKAKTDNIPAQGQALAVASMPVVLTSIQQAALTPPAAITGFNLETTQVAMSAKLPATLGQKAAAASLAVITSTEDQALMGSLTETAPITDTASAGHNGRLQRIAQRLSSLIALFPVALGQGTMAQSLTVAIASNQTAVPVSVKQAARTASFSENLTLSTVAIITAPANAFGCMVETDSANGNNIRVKQGGAAASATSGIQFQPGRSEYYDCGTDLSVCSESGTNAISVQWFIQ